MHFFNEVFWVGLSFILFMALIAKPVSRIVIGQLDARTARIRRELDEAVRLKEEAQSLLTAYQRRQKEAEEEAKKIVAHAKQEAKRILEDSEQMLEEAVNKRIEMSMQKIATYENSVVQDVKRKAIDSVMASVQSLVSQYLDEKSAEKLLAESLEQAEERL